jgi:hypothetical protein
MSEIKKIIGQSAPSATTEATLYTVPDSKGAVISSLTVCNRGAAATFRVSVSYGGNATANTDYIYYDLPIAANETFIATIGVTVSNTDKIRVYASTANLTFQAYGAEFDQTNVYGV